jgi:hypothetical protein
MTTVHRGAASDKSRNSLVSGTAAPTSSRVPQKYDRAAYVTRFAREAQLLPADLRELLEPAAAGSAAGTSSAGPATGGAR